MAPKGDLKLELVQVLFRHGARTNSRSEIRIAMPEYVDPSLHETFGYEQLTNIGRAQAYDLGRILRDRYNDYLGPYYKSDDLYAYSSDYDRTKMSLQLVLAGLYPPAPEQIWNENLRWQPIPTHHVPQPADVLLKAFDMPKYKSLLKVVRNSSRFKEAEKRLKNLDEFLQGQGIQTLHKNGFIGTIGVFNVLSSHKASKAKLPDWFTNDLYEDLKRNVVSYFDLMASSPELCKWQIGPLVKRILDNMNVKEEVANPRKIYLYSGHELNIAAYTRAHGIKEFQYPDYSNAVILEKLRNSQNRLYVRMLGWTGKDEGFITLKLGNHEEYCPVEEYIELVKDVTPSDEEMDSLYADISNDLKSLHLSDSVFKPKPVPSFSVTMG